MMKQSFYKIKTFIQKYYLILLGLFCFVIYFWNRFLRIRISKELPLNLSIIKFFFIFNICIIFIFILFSLIFPRKNNQIIEQIITWLFIPLIEFDKYLKSINVIKNLNQVFYNKMYGKLSFLIIDTNWFFIIFWLIPRLILLSALWIDIFIFHRLHYKYMVILFGLLLFFNSYFKYSLKNNKEELIKYHKNNIESILTPYVPKIHPAELTSDYNPDDPDEEDDSEFMALPLETFIEFQTNSIVYQNIIRKIINIKATMTLYDLLWNKYFNLQKTPDESYFNLVSNKQKERFIFDKKDEFIKREIENITIISLFLEYYNKNINQQKEIKNIKILIYLNYLICWLYVLIISFHTLDLQKLIVTLLRTSLTLQEPFSDEYISNSY